MPQQWTSTALAERCGTVAAARHRVAESVDEFVRLARSEQRSDDIDTVAAEILPLCEALRYLGRQGPRILRSRTVGWRGRPLWLWGLRSDVQRVPRGTVLILGAWNYPLLLGGVQVAQALAAGNTVLWKPAPGSEAGCAALARCLFAAGVPESALRLLSSDVQAAESAIDAGVDLVVLTGSATTGRAVLRRAAETLTPAIMELSGCDAALVLRSGSLSRAADAIRFGLTINAGATCIGPRRLLLEQPIAEPLLQQLDAQLRAQPACVVHPSARPAVLAAVQDALQRGGRDRLGRWDAETLAATGKMFPTLIDGVAADWPIAAADLFAPVATIQRVDSAAQAVERCNACCYGLAASVFAEPSVAAEVAGQLRVGSVAINDLIAPTADPRLPFGGRGNSGFGVTRGAEGLLQMTAIKVTSCRRGSALPHLGPHDGGLLETLLGALQIQHARGFAPRWAGLRQMLRGVRASRTSQRTQD